MIIFAAAVNYNSGPGTASLVTAGFNHDGQIDIASININSNSISLQYRC
ncbi:MAG: hypothetical protein MRQ13_04745 [Candidatus Midichloria sp.]|nr:hypothetical protein [Candidatus Midichloria sp.]